jgi:hypothetical protein
VRCNGNLFVRFLIQVAQDHRVGTLGSVVQSFKAYGFFQFQRRGCALMVSVGFAVVCFFAIG